MDVGDLPVDQLAVRRHSHPHRGVRPGRVDPPELGAHRLKCLLLIRRSTIACAPVIETVSTPPLLPPASGVCDGCPPVRRGRPLASVMDGCPSGPSGSLSPSAERPVEAFSCPVWPLACRYLTLWLYSVELDFFFISFPKFSSFPQTQAQPSPRRFMD